MRLGPATQAALLCVSPARFSSQGAATLPLKCVRENAIPVAHFQVTTRGPQPASTTCNDCSSWRFSSSDAWDSTRKPQRQVIPNAHHASLKLLPAIHPREPPEAPALLQSVAFKTSHVCTGDTLLEERNRRNRKSMPGCEQTVEDETSLWKAPEKRKRIINGGRASPTG